MPTVTLNKKVIKKLVGRELDDETLKNRLTYLAISVENMTEDEVVIEVEPNRPDWLSEQGVARSLASFIGEKKGLKKYSIHESGRNVIIDKSVKKIRPYTACAIVSNLHFDDEKIREIIQIQEKLHVTYGRNRKKVAIGIYPSEKITYPITFLAKKPKDIKFQPLEFNTEMTANEILSDHPTGKEYAHLLQGLDKYPLFIDAAGKVLSMPPIINSHDVGKITESTNEVFIECSGFDYEVLSKCLNMIVTALADMGGEIKSMTLEYGAKKITSPNLIPSKMKFNSKYTNKILGVKLDEKQIIEALHKMGYDIDGNYALVPAYRSDVLHPIDLVEDVAIGYGYENFKEIIPRVATIGKQDDFDRFKNRVLDFLTGFGFFETNTYCIINKEEQQAFIQSQDDDLVELANSVSIEYNSLRRRMFPSHMIILRNNRSNEYPQSFFECGRVFKKDSHDKNTGVKEEDNLVVTICGADVDYTRIRQILDAIFGAINEKCELEKHDAKFFIHGRSAEVIYNGKHIGVLGEVHPKVIDNFEIEMPVASLEINLTALYNMINKK